MPQPLRMDMSYLAYATACRTLNEALSMRTFLAGYTLTVADMAIWGQLQGNLVHSGPFRCKVTCFYLMHGPARLQSFIAQASPNQLYVLSLCSCCREILYVLV